MSIQLHVPEGLTVSQFELSMLFATKLFEEGLITSGTNILNQLAVHGFWLSETLKHQILARMGEAAHD